MSTVEETAPDDTRPRLATPRVWLTNILFTATILISATLIFAVQPMISKMLLPPYGGAASVWTTSLLFFQTVLLVGYAYAHYAPKLVGRLHPLIHLVLVAVPLLMLPITLPAWAAPEESTTVVIRVLLVLCVMVAMPFAVLSATGPLVQSWYSKLGMPRSHDPYFLYAASNVGSIAGLLLYPFVIEPLIGVQTQSLWWSFTYGVFAVMICGCALFAWRSRRSAPQVAQDTADTAPEPESEPEPEPESGSGPGARASALTWRRRLVWLVLAALPSSLLQGTTTHITTDIAAVPLLWVVPLALYLSTHIIAFGVRRHAWVTGTIDLAVVGVFPLVLVAVFPALLSTWVTMLLSLVMLTVVALATHGMLAKDRPAPVHLTEFFMLVSLGGALGSLFNGIVAPLVFDQVLEYPLVLASVALLCLAGGQSSRAVRWVSRTRWARLTLIAFVAGALLLMYSVEEYWTLVVSTLLAGLTIVGIVRNRAVRAVAIAVLGLAVILSYDVFQDDVVNGRTFFGAYSVSENDTERVVSHGTTVHGYQLLDPNKRDTPVSYYARTGPVGDVFAAYGGDAQRVGVIGLGAGGIAAYGESGQQFDFYEIDPEMVRVARNPEWFTFLEDCRCEVDTIVGDGRMRIAEKENGTYDMIALDAFSSDSVPTHLLNREALEMYAERLAPGGVILVNVSNRNVELAPMVGATAQEVGLSGMVREDANSGEDANPHAEISTWIVLASDDSELEPLTQENPDEWRTVPDDGPVWTDSYSSLFGVLKW